MPRYLFQGTADSGGQQGPTLQRVQDRALFQRGKANVLENLFDTVAPLGMYSGDAHGRLGLPNMSSVEKATLKQAIKNGATPQQILRDFNLFYDGKNWSRYTPDEMTDLSQFFAKQNKYGRMEDYMGPSVMSLGDVVKNSPLLHKDIPVHLKDLKNDGIGGYAQPSYTNPSIAINMRNGRSPQELFDSLGHEYNHIVEPVGRSQGTSPSQISPQVLQRLSAQEGKNIDAYTTYLHNTGEIRARANSALNKDASGYTGLSDLFPEGKFNQNLIWGD